MMRRASMEVALGVLAAALPAGCQTPEGAHPTRVANPRLGVMLLAVAPALNHSGSRDFDPVRVADLMASELTYAEGVQVIPVNRVMAVLAEEGRTDIESPRHALDVVRRLGADGIVVFAITEYEPYDPPIVGITAQLYGRGAVDQADDPAFSGGPQTEGGAQPADVSEGDIHPIAQTQRVYDASQRYVVERVRRFAADRDADDSPYGWRRYVVSQQHFLRFCCHAAVEELLQGTSAGAAAGAPPENRVQ